MIVVAMSRHLILLNWERPQSRIALGRKLPFTAACEALDRLQLLEDLQEVFPMLQDWGRPTTSNNQTWSRTRGGELPGRHPAPGPAICSSRRTLRPAASRYAVATSALWPAHTKTTSPCCGSSFMSTTSHTSPRHHPVARTSFKLRRHGRMRLTVQGPATGPAPRPLRRVFPRCGRCCQSRAGDAAEDLRR